MTEYQIIHGDCRDILPTLDKASAIVTDPPYELGFMGKSWDSKGVSFQKETWQAVRESCKSGAMLLSFGGTRTFHRIACAIEDAGFEYRDTIMWVYGSGFPKSLDISKAIDKQAGAEREVVNTTPTGGFKRLMVHNKEQGFRPNDYYPEGNNFVSGVPITPEAQLWNGYGTALKPAYEPIIVAMNPIDGTFANNALKHGVAGINIDECRVETQDVLSFGSREIGDGIKYGKCNPSTDGVQNPQGRFPANFIHDGSQIVMDLFPNSKPTKPHRVFSKVDKYEGYGNITQKHGEIINYDETETTAARFFYCAKASKSERDKGMDDMELSQYSHDGRQKPIENPYQRNDSVARNNHPTVKPLALMEYLIKLVTMPEYNLIIDPFCGSGSTLVACIKLGIPCIGIDSDEKSCEIANKRCSSSQVQ